MTRDEVDLSPALHGWVTNDEHEVEGWAEDLPIAQLRCHPDLVERLAQIARPVRGARRAWVDGCPVVHHPGGAPIAFATGTHVLVVRSAQPAGTLAPGWHTNGLTGDWTDVDPWAADVTFAKTLELLRNHLRHAFALAGAR